MPSARYDEAYENESFEYDNEDDNEDDEGLAARSAPTRMTASEQSPDPYARARASALAQQRVAAHKARVSQQQLGSRIAGITKPLRGSSGLAQPRGLAPVAGRASVTVTMPNGRRTQMQIAPAMASADSVNRLRAQVAANDRRQSTALAASSRAIGRLGETQAAAVKKLTQQQLASDRALTKRLVGGDAKLDKRVTTELVKAVRGHAVQDRRAAKAIAREKRRALWNNLLLASALPFFTAFGKASDPFARNNLLLTGSLSAWMLGDEIVDRFVVDQGTPRKGRKGRKGRKDQGMQAWSRGADLWSYLAPAGNAATAWFLFKDQQNVRFLSGITSISISAGGSAPHATVPLDIALKSEEAFKARKNVRVVASLVSATNVIAVTATVREGVLELTLIRPSGFGSGGSAEVAWIVDTQDPDA
jgi:hypothetical protein